jgi:Na+-translocating ferredoxin:NAD+ oxidoreductase RnfG subunit
LSKDEVVVAKADWRLKANGHSHFDAFAGAAK